MMRLLRRLIRRLLRRGQRVVAPGAAAISAEQLPIWSHLDRIDPTLAGWVGHARDSSVSKDTPIQLSLMLGQTRLGRVDFTLVRPDVDAHCGYEGPAKGFDVAVTAVLDFAAMTSSKASLRAEAGAETSIAIDLASAGGAQRPLEWFGSRLGHQLVDLWMNNSHRLLMRFEGMANATPIAQLQFFQHNPRSSSGPVRLSASMDGLRGPLNVIGCDLLNPFLPLLIVALDSAEALLFADCLPFPSLVRGGAHALETRACSRGGDPNQALVDLSSQLAGYLASRKTDPAAHPATCAVLRFDCRDCAGSEALFDEDLLDALVFGFDVAVEVVGDEPLTPVQNGLRAQLARRDESFAGTPRRQGLTLVLRGDTVPCLSALLGPARVVDREGPTVRSSAYVSIVDEVGEAWLIGPPAASASATGVAFGSAPAVLRGGAHRELPAALLDAAPLAICRARARTRLVDNGVFPVAIDAPELSPNRAQPAPVSAIVTPGPDGQIPVALLQSLADQHGAAQLEVVYLIEPRASRPAAERVLDALFGGRYRILPNAASIPLVVAFRRGVTRASHEHLLLLRGDTILHDPRTLGVLSRELAGEGAGSVSCGLIRQVGTRVDFACAGYFLDAIEYRGAPSLRFDAPDVRRILRASYSAVASPLSVLAIRKAVIERVPVPFSVTGRCAADEILFGMEIHKLALENVVTIDVTATTSRTDFVRNGLAAALSLDAQVLQRFATHATGLQKL